MQMSDHVLLLTQLDLPCLRNVVRILSSLERQEGLNDKIRVVVNRVGIEKNQISFSSAEETINREIFWKIPNNYGVVAESRNNGVPLIKHAPKAAVTVSLSEMAAKISTPSGEQDEEADEKKEKKGWLKFLSK
jgi:pilus assembly protein CpaE